MSKAIKTLLTDSYPAQKKSVKPMKTKTMKTKGKK